MKLIKSIMLLAICLGANNFLFAQPEPAITAKSIELKPAVATDSKPNPAIISKPQTPAELKTADSQNNIPTTIKEEMPKPQVIPSRVIANSSSSTDIIFPNTPLTKPIIADEASVPVTNTTPKQLPANKNIVVSQTPKKTKLD
jgi:hypothetical protein